MKTDLAERHSDSFLFENKQKKKHETKQKPNVARFSQKDRSFPFKTSMKQSKNDNKKKGVRMNGCIKSTRAPVPIDSDNQATGAYNCLRNGIRA